MQRLDVGTAYFCKKMYRPNLSAWFLPSIKQDRRLRQASTIGQFQNVHYSRPQYPLYRLPKTVATITTSTIGELTSPCKIQWRSEGQSTQRRHSRRQSGAFLREVPPIALFG